MNIDLSKVEELLGTSSEYTAKQGELAEKMVHCLNRLTSHYAVSEEDSQQVDELVKALKVNAYDGLEYGRYLAKYSLRAILMEMTQVTPCLIYRVEPGTTRRSDLEMYDILGVIDGMSVECVLEVISDAKSALPQVEPGDQYSFNNDEGIEFNFDFLIPGKA